MYVVRYSATFGGLLLDFPMFVPNGQSRRGKLVDSVEELNDINSFFNHSYRMQIRYIEYEQIYNPATRSHLKTLEDKLRISCSIFENALSTGNFNDRTLLDVQENGGGDFA